MSYNIWLGDNRGNRSTLIDHFESLEYTRTTNDVGAFRLVLPPTFDRQMATLDGILEIWRAPTGQPPNCEGVYFIRHMERTLDARGKQSLTIAGPDLNHLLSRRIVAYAAKSAYSDKSDNPDDLLRAYVRENLGSLATDADRDLTGYGLSVQPDLALVTPTQAKAAARRNLLSVLQEIARTANQNGLSSSTRVYFDVVPTGFSPLTLEFQAYKNQLGMDRSVTGSVNPIILSPEFNNLDDVRLEYDYTDEATVCYVGGMGMEANRDVVEVIDTARAGASPWNRCEIWHDAGQEYDSDADLTDAGSAALWGGRPVVNFRGRLVESAMTRYGRDWWLGDKLTAEVFGERLDVIVGAVSVRVTAAGEEIEARLDYAA